ncbi:MAG: hypothetical protein MI923_22575 [Phycisphaerales bacterium]|nr:hypothetical protein [Phycisphaerales bacterium]
MVDTDTCSHHPGQADPSECENKSVAGPILVQTGHTQACPGGVVNWAVLHTVWYDNCGNNCFKVDILATCLTGACGAGPQAWGPDNRGVKKRCGCP